MNDALFSSLRWISIGFACLVVTSGACSQAQCLRQSDCPPPSVCRKGICRLPPKPYDYDASAYWPEPSFDLPDASAPLSSAIPTVTPTVSTTTDAGPVPFP